MTRSVLMPFLFSIHKSQIDIDLFGINNQSVRQFMADMGQSNLLNKIDREGTLVIDELTKSECAWIINMTLFFALERYQKVYPFPMLPLIMKIIFVFGLKVFMIYSGIFRKIWITF